MSDLSPEARAIVRAGARDDGPSDGDRDRVRRAVMAAIAGGGASAASSAAEATSSAAQTGASATGASGSGLATTTATATATGASLATKLLIVAAVGLGAGTGIYLASDGGGSEAPEPSVAPEKARDRGPNPAREASSGPKEVRHVMPPAAPEPAPAVAPEPEPEPEPEPDVAPERDTTAAADLAREQQLLRAAARAMQTGDPEHALSLLDEHAASFPDGQLEPERAATRVHVLCALERVDQARAAAAAFRERHPRSPLLPRIDRSCAGP